MILEFQVLAVLPEDMAHISAERQVQLVSGVEGVDPLSVGVHSRNDDDHIFSICISMEVDLAAHQLGDLNGCGQSVAGLLGQHHVAGPDAQGNLLRRHIAGS